jgi:hypothetical protein
MPSHHSPVPIAVGENADLKHESVIVTATVPYRDVEPFTAAIRKRLPLSLASHSGDGSKEYTDLSLRFRHPIAAGIVMEAVQKAAAELGGQVIAITDNPQPQPGVLSISGTVDMDALRRVPAKPGPDASKRLETHPGLVAEGPGSAGEAMRVTSGAGTRGERPARAPYDVFISHAHEDKEAVARPLATELRSRGIKVWYDEFALSLGDSLRQTIDRGLAESRFGVVVLSPSFFAKEWPMRELNGLTTREGAGEKVILPLWHGVQQSDVARYSPLLADRLAITTDRGIIALADAIIAVIMW